MSGVYHGGRLDEAVKLYGGERKNWLDLSTGINPQPWPVPDIDKALWHNLPDAHLFENAERAARKLWRVPDKAAVSIVSGSQAHIQLLPFLFGPQAVSIIGFTYQEHGICWQRAGHKVFVADGLASAERTARIVIAVNPNNPDGQIIDRDGLLESSRRLGVKGGLLIVDETFGDVTPMASVMEGVGHEGLLVLRSLGKFHGLAGARVGFSFSSPGIAEKLNSRLGPWAVSGPALSIAADALSDIGWTKRTRKKLGQQRKELEDMLVAGGLLLEGGTDLFVLASHPRAGALHAHLCTREILTRPFPSRSELLRFGLLPNKSAAARLQRALKAFLLKD